MCWSATGSLATWAAGMTLAGATYGYEPKLWLFMIVFTQMQLVEYFLWKNLHVPRLNVLGSQAAAFLVFLEPIMAIYMIEDVNLRNKVFAGYAVYVMTVLLTHRFNFKTVVGGNGHLEWKWLPPTTVMIPWFLFFLIPLWISGHNYAFILSGMTLLMSTYYYTKYNTVSSMWCWIAVSSWILLLMNKILKT
jgi:hypothetical protein